MAGKRKFRIEDIKEWSEAEKQFVELCNERNWIVDNEEETGAPVLYPSHAKYKGVYSVCVFGVDKNGNTLMSLGITAKHGRTKEALLKKANRANLKGELRLDSETDAEYIFPIERLPRAVKTFNLRRKQNHKGPPKDAIKKGQEALAKWREEQKK